MQVERFGINPVDVFMREGGFAVLPSLPFILGKEASGIVLRKGKNVSKFKVSN